MKSTLGLLAGIVFVVGLTAAAAETNSGSFPVQIRVAVDKPGTELRPIWRYFGYDEPNFTYMKDGQQLLAELGQLGPQTVYIRSHHLLTSGDGTPALKWGSTAVYSETATGKPIYNWDILDRIFDTLMEKKVKPLVEIGFMPEALSTHPQDYPHNPPRHEKVFPGVGFSYPPKDYDKWRELCFQWAKHCAARYGQAEVDQWQWEVWNEPNINYWKGTPQEYHKLYDYATDGIRRALPMAGVGGPHTAGGPGGRFLRDFLEHCLHGTNYANGKPGSPLSFVAFHAKGNPRYESNHVRMGISAQLANIDDGFATVASFPELKSTPIIIGESDPEGCAACTGPQLGYRNGTMYSSYTAASFARKHDLAAKHGVNLEGALTWAFEFEEEPYFAGFRVLASNGIDLPVLNVFRMFGMMSGRRLPVSSSAAYELETIRRKGVREHPDVSALASSNGKRTCVFLWHYHDDDLPGPAANVDLQLDGATTKNGKVTEYRIDGEHSNAFAVWKKMGAPQSPTPQQYAELKRAAQLARMGERTIENGHVKVELPRQGVVLLIAE